MIPFVKISFATAKIYLRCSSDFKWFPTLRKEIFPSEALLRGHCQGWGRGESRASGSLALGLQSKWSPLALCDSTALGITCVTIPQPLLVLVLFWNKGTPAGPAYR